MASGMTKTQLVRHLAEKTELPNKTVAAFLEQLADVAVKETKKSGVFVVPGLGRLVKAQRKARMGRNPRTGEGRIFSSQCSNVASPIKAVIICSPTRTACASLLPGPGDALRARTNHTSKYFRGRMWKR